MISIKTPIRFLEAVILDLLSIPGNFMSKESNAKWHLKVVCPLCSKWRKSFRCAGKNKGCMWHEAWTNGRWSFSRNFGTGNWLKYYFGLKTDIRKYHNEFKRLPRKKGLRKGE